MPPDADQGPSDAERVRTGLHAALARVEESFERDELAYLTLTSKVEAPVRDRLAWALREELGDEFLVAREWRRADLAVLTARSELVAQVEAKVLCTFNALNPKSRARYIGYLASDAWKMTNRGGSERFLLSIIFDVRGSVPPHLKGVVKYSAEINRYATKHPDGDGRTKAAEAWKQALAEEFEGDTHVRAHDAGDMWDLGVTIDCFLTGPLKSHAP